MWRPGVVLVSVFLIVGKYADKLSIFQTNGDLEDIGREEFSLVTLAESFRGSRDDEGVIMSEYLEV